MRRSFTLPALLLGAILTLTGCSGEPNADDMKTSLESAMKANPILAAMFSGFEDFEKVACKEAEGKPGYVCDYKATHTIMGQKTTAPGTARFVEGDNGWEAQLQ